LGRVARLCSDASAYLAAIESEPQPAAIAITATDLTKRIAEAVQAQGLAWTGQAIQGGSVRVTGVDTATSAIAAVLATVRRPNTNSIDLAVEATADGDRLYLTAGTDAQRTALMSDGREPIDPWRGGHGLALPLAFVQLASIAGVVWTTATARPGVAVALPLEGSTP
jgi:hypothetical protein